MQDRHLYWPRSGPPLFKF